MRVRLFLRFEPTVSNTVWTAESPDVPGFYAARGSLDELAGVVETAVREILEEARWSGEIAFEHEYLRHEHLRHEPSVPAAPPT
jgi:predicted RNase H-like HicB family nuclease